MGYIVSDILKVVWRIAFRGIGPHCSAELTVLEDVVRGFEEVVAETTIYINPFVCPKHKVVFCWESPKQQFPHKGDDFLGDGKLP